MTAQDERVKALMGRLAGPELGQCKSLLDPKQPAAEPPTGGAVPEVALLRPWADCRRPSHVMEHNSSNEDLLT